VESPAAVAARKAAQEKLQGPLMVGSITAGVLLLCGLGYQVFTSYQRMQANRQLPRQAWEV
jgi:hypothetical protein